MKGKLEAIIDRLVVEALTDSQFATWGPEHTRLLKRQIGRAFDLGTAVGYDSALEEHELPEHVQ